MLEKKTDAVTVLQSVQLSHLLKFSASVFHLLLTAPLKASDSSSHHRRTAALNSGVLSLTTLGLFLLNTTIFSTEKSNSETWLLSVGDYFFPPIRTPKHPSVTSSTNVHFTFSHETQHHCRYFTIKTLHVYQGGVLLYLFSLIQQGESVRSAPHYWSSNPIEIERHITHAVHTSEKWLLCCYDCVSPAGSCAFSLSCVYMWTEGG